MSTAMPRNIATKITQKFRLEDLTTGDYRYPVTVSGSCLSLLIKRYHETETIGIFIESEHGIEEMSVSFKLINHTTKSLERKYTSVIDPSQDWGWINFISLKEVSDRNKGWLDSDGYLTLEVSVSEPSHRRGIRNIGAQSDLVENLFKYAKTVKDLTVCSGDGKEYVISEYIFACHSEVLATHLGYKIDGKIIFKDIESNVMDEFIFYLKNGLVNKSAESVAFDLAEIAHMYELPRLFELVEPLLVNQVRSGQLSRVIKIAKRFDSAPLFEAIGKIEEVSEELLSKESENFTVQVHGETLSINLAFLTLKYPHLEGRRDEIINALQSTTLQAAKGFINFLKTSQLDGLAQCLSEYASLASALHLPQLTSRVEEEVISHMTKYDRRDVMDLADAMKSLKIFRALAASR